MYQRLDQTRLKEILREKDSVLILGPRQVGKTTLLRLLAPQAIAYDFARPEEKLRISKDPALLVREIRGRVPRGGLFAIDEIQKVPSAFDSVQVLLDDPHQKYIGILTGSSARKLKRGAVNTLPGRVLQFRLGPLTAQELGFYSLKKEEERQALLLSMMTRGNLPRIQGMTGLRAARHLRSYVQTYLEEEILGDALTKDVGQFARFLTVMASRSGSILNYSALSQESGASVNTIKHHVEVLIDTLTAYSIPGFSFSDTKTWLSTPRLLLFDLGVRNAAAERVIDEKAASPEYGTLFEQWVSLEILAWIRNREPPIQLYYWRTTQNREIDWIIRRDNQILAVEVKWSESWRPHDLTHLEAFSKIMLGRKYRVTTLLVCRTPHPAEEGGHLIIPPYRLLESLENWIEPARSSK